MTKTQVLKIFKEHDLPILLRKYGLNDKLAISGAWLDYVDMLNKDRVITDKQANTWSNPFSK